MKLLVMPAALLLGGTGPRFAAGETAGPLPKEFYRGVCYAHVHRREHGYGSQRSARELIQLRRLGVRWVALTPFGYQENVQSEKIVGYPGMEGITPFFTDSDPTMLDENLAREIAAAHAAGMKVLVKPHLWAGDFVDEYEWPGTIRQTSIASHKLWWISYRAFILHYAKVAADAGADMFCVGTELAKMTLNHPNEWRALVKEVRAIPARSPMHLTYSAHWEKEYQLIAFWDELDFIGVGAYFPLNAPLDASVEDLVRAWRPHRENMERLATVWKKPVLFTEVGYRPVADAHRSPWVFSGGKRQPEAQARAYEALFRAFFDAAWWKGAFLWKTFTDPDLASDRRAGGEYSFRYQPAEQVVQRWYVVSRGPGASAVPPSADNSLPPPALAPAKKN